MSVIESLKKIKRKVFDKWERLSLYLFNNHLGFRMNAFYALHHAYCSICFLIRNKKFEKNPKGLYFRKERYAALDTNEARKRLAEKDEEAMMRLYNDPKNHSSKTGDPSFVQIIEPTMRMEGMTDFIDKEVEDILHTFFKSYFKIYRASLYRTLPKSDSYENLKNAWRWHRDSYPSEIVKVMFYLTDTDRHTGALRVHSYDSSRDLLAEGFLDRYQDGQYIEKLDDPKRFNWLEGKAGTILFFDDNLVHRATPPETGYRDVIVFEVMPSGEYWKAHYERAKSLVSSDYRKNKMKWPLNPFND